MTITDVRCGVCGRPCVPLADYAAPVCHACDAAVEAIMTRANLTPPARAALFPPTRLPVTRTLASCYGPGAPEAIAELLDDLFPNDPPGRPRRSAQQPATDLTRLTASKRRSA